MDSGLAAVLGAGITGSVASLGALLTYRQTKVQLRSNAKLALREPRRKVYRDFLTGSREAVQAVLDVVDEDTGEAALGPLGLALDEHSPVLMRLLAEVDLEGPQAVSDAANEVVEKLVELHSTALAADLSGPVDDEGRPARIGGDFLAEVRTAMKEFVVVARAALATDAD
ncbi:hypothetical protein [Streptomyces rubradiris]|uniref:Uncharacterized protein n=1 Tax=Streptomyces rubradiris TaxID=285531 RepID=A0ABQ3REZ9_STRRR|nr:hypothetical protein [Streptomyces rubradiris]GHG97824.1 hypothetical protein GCM10018792_09970 [Streptomyces rubradiris]GHI54384.1 hypothetical protein Srubr_42300 [Streptomyces rubradiris]